MRRRPRARHPAPHARGGTPPPPLLFRGWLVVAGAFLVLMVGYGAAYSFAAFAEELARSFGSSRASVSLIYAICGFTAFTASAVTGPLSDTVGPRPLAAGGMVLVSLGLLTSATAQSMMEVYLCYGLLVGLGIGFAYVPAVAAVQRWFVAGRGLASGIAAAGIGFGTALVPPMAGGLALLGDWRVAFLVSGLLAALVGLGGAMLLASSPESRGLTPDGQGPAARPAPMAGARLEGPELKAVLRMRGYWLLYAGTLLVSVPVSLPFAHLAHSAEAAGLAATDALSLLSLLGIASIAGRFLLGALADEVGRDVTFLACCTGVAALTLLWAAAASPVAMTVFAIGFGVTYGGFVALLPAFVTDAFGRRAAAGAIGVLYTGRGAALLLSAPALAEAADAFDGYGLPLVMVGGLGAIGVFLASRASKAGGRGAGQA